MKYLVLIIFIFLFSIYDQAVGLTGVTGENRLTLDKNFISCTKKLVAKGFENDKEFKKNNKKNSLYKKNEKKIIKNFYEKNLGLGTFDYTFANAKPKLLMSIPKEYFSCRCLKPGSLADKKSFFDWCACRKARASTRLYLVFDIVNRLSGRDKNKELVYVSFGSGKLLQDYLIINALIESGFKNINVNLIDLAYKNSKNIIDGEKIDKFLDIFCRNIEERFDEKDSLCAFCNLVKLSKSIKNINSYTTYFDFLQNRGEKSADLLLLIDPMKVYAELLQTNDFERVNHVCIKGQFRFLDEIMFLLPYWGKPRIFYKVRDDFDKTNQDVDFCQVYSLGRQKCQFFKNSCLDFILSMAKGYRGYGDRKNFIKGLDLCFNFNLSKNKLYGNEKFEIATSQSQRYSFYDIARETFYKNSLVYQLDKNQIFFGFCDLLSPEYFGSGYWELVY